MFDKMCAMTVILRLLTHPDRRKGKQHFYEEMDEANTPEHV